MLSYKATVSLGSNYLCGQREAKRVDGSVEYNFVEASIPAKESATLR